MLLLEVPNLPKTYQVSTTDGPTRWQYCPSTTKMKLPFGQTVKIISHKHNACGNKKSRVRTHFTNT